MPDASRDEQIAALKETLHQTLAELVALGIKASSRCEFTARPPAPDVPWPWTPPTYRLVCVDPIADLIEACEAMPEFSIDHPERYADLLCAKESISEQGFDVCTEPPTGIAPWDNEEVTPNA